MKYDKVINGISKYIAVEMYPAINDWQEILARMVISRAMANQEQIRKAITNNPIVKALALVDDNGDIDIDTLMKELKEQITAKGNVEIRLPMFGKFTFTANDVDKLYKMISEA